MPSLAWYAARLQAMSLGEVLWRLRSTTRDALRRRGIGQPRLGRRRARGPNFAEIADARERPCAPGGACCASPAYRRLWRDPLMARADAAARGVLSIFDLTQANVGDPPRWNRDVKTRTDAPLSFAPSIDYRRFDLVGDAKFIWELNRHHHLVVLARAAAAGGDRGYAKAVAAHLRSWLDQCPAGRGMNWRSPLELAVRLINWTWTLELCERAAVDDDLRARLADAIDLHVREIAENYSRGSSANNHLIGEAAGVFVATSCLGPVRGLSRHRRRARAILEREILNQTFADGGAREQAFGYHVFVLQFFTLCALVAQRRGEPFRPAFLERLERMYDFLAAMIEGGDELPQFGDGDDGYVLDLAGGGSDPRGWLAVGALLFESPALKAAAGEMSESAFWLFGDQAAERWAAIPDTGNAALDARAFPDTGRYLLQRGARGSTDRVSVHFDCGPHGYLSIAAHAHADALSFTLRAFGMDFVVDPGTYDYFSHPHWRDALRATRAHATIEVDDADQTAMLGPFLWGRPARARLLEWAPSPGGGRVCAEHDGYARNADRVIHRRELILDGDALAVHDVLEARGAHRVAWRLPLAEHCRVVEVKRGRCEVAFGPHRATIDVDPQLDLFVLHGQRTPPAGWVSRGYHRVSPAPVLVGRAATRGRVALRSMIRLRKGGD